MYGKKKHAMDPKPVLLNQASNKQELTCWENILITYALTLFIIPLYNSNFRGIQFYPINQILF